MSGTTGGGVTVPTVPVPVNMGGTGVTSSTGSGSNVLNTNPTLYALTVAYSLDPTKYFGIDVDAAGTLHFRPQGNDYATISSGGALVLNGGFQSYGLQANPVTINGAANGAQVLIGIDTAVASGNNVGAVIGNIKGTGALTAQVPDSTAAGGNARGANAVDLQTSRTSATNVASGQYSTVTGGNDNRASGTGSVAGGTGSAATATAAVAFGDANLASGARSVAIGSSNSAGGSFSVALGYQLDAHNLIGAFVTGSGRITTTGDAQAGQYVLRRQSTAGATVRLTADGLPQGSANIANIPLNTAWSGDIRVTARETSTGNCARWVLNFGMGVQGTAATTTVVTGAVEFQNIIGGVAAIGNVAVAADTTNRGISISFTPPNTNTWNVVAVIRAAEVQ